MAFVMQAALPLLTQFGQDLEMPMDLTNLAGLAASLGEFTGRFAACFPSGPSRRHLATYVQGQLGPLQRKSIEPIAVQAKVCPRTLQQFISAHKWDEAAMRAGVRSIVREEHADPHAVGIIDETSFNKKGRNTVGVKRQWCGHTGKIDNCVQTVHLSYVSRDFATIIDSDLYLPKEWLDDDALRLEAKIPPGVTFRKKAEIAVELLRRSITEGVPMRWVTADEFYGRSSEFLASVEALGLKYIVEVPVSTCGWTARAFSRNEEHRRVDALFQRGGPSWVDYNVKETTKGPAVWRVKAIRFVLHAGIDRSEKWLLIAQNPLDKEIKYFLSNACAETSIEALLIVAFTRWRIEHTFHESKEEIGLDHFEVRSYVGLQRHMAISMVSMLFLVRTTLNLRVQTTDHWTVPQVRPIANLLVNASLSPEQRDDELKQQLRIAAHWQKRSKAAQISHRKRRLRDLEKAGVDLETATKCPPWFDGST